MQVLAATESIVNRLDAVHMTRGRKVLEIRPRVDWDKGKALLHLLRALGLDEADDIVPLYIGDDRTDEDAFKVLKGSGVGVLVSTRPKQTDAGFVLSDPEEVRHMQQHSCLNCEGSFCPCGASSARSLFCFRCVLDCIDHLVVAFALGFVLHVIAHTGRSGCDNRVVTRGWLCRLADF
jgi:hypothetical protein